MNSIIIYKYESPVGDLILGSFNNKLCLCDWEHRKARKAIDTKLQKHLNAQYTYGTSNVILETLKQLNEYFNKNRTIFDLPLLFIGTDFQKSIWMALSQIPYGNTKTYSQLSEELNNPKATRAVANAIGANPMSIIIPCHRIIGSNGSLTGYAGGLDAKEKLLISEK